MELWHPKTMSRCFSSTCTVALCLSHNHVQALAYARFSKAVFTAGYNW